DLEATYQELLSIANTKDSNGHYLFAGYKSATQPFSETAPGVVVYSGDNGQHIVQIGAARTVAAGDSGEAIFRAIKNGNGTFAATATPGNNGSGVIDSGVVIDPTLWHSAGNSQDFTIRFDVTAGVTTYDIVDNVNNVSLLTGAAPAAGPYLRTF